MRALAIAAVLVFAAAPAYAAPPNLDVKKDDGKLSAARQAEQDAAYKSSLQRIPVKDAVVDPWGAVRPGDGNPSSQGGSKKPASPAR